MDGGKAAVARMETPRTRHVDDSAADDPSVLQSVFTITEKAPTRAFSWLKAHTRAFTFKTLLRDYAKRALTPR